ncbi:endonuclease III domain-containing protein [Halobiforma nitratireducens]|uniref:HhH-GPD family protein n=1 Tax=Halobiforma nitratireducens JCM 10879 TaxID=1227454 RepID=M0LZQ0_9EURY|nr:endonuclease III [Halobiforma nitratireducens]EMA37595.1 HhH-GPD family protein [Halobiforma nitratireducens JCM 10879]
MEDPEPSVNISGGEAGGGVAAEFDSETADTRAERVVDRLGELYWEKTYGGRDAFTCLVRTVLSQNTSDKASQPAHDALLERYEPSADSDADLATALADAEQSTLAETISGAGLYNQKSEVLIDVAEWVLETFGSAEAFDAFVTDEEPDTVRKTLLEVSGVGPKTADCVLLFAGGRPGVFPVDTHVHRIYRRLGVAPPEADHEAVRAVLEEAVPAAKCGFGPQNIAKRYNEGDQSEEEGFHKGGTYEVNGEVVAFAHGGVPPEKCGFGHTATIQFGREYCTARKPACLDGPESCPLFDLCDRVGVNLETGEVVDPSEDVPNR